MPLLTSVFCLLLSDFCLLPSAAQAAVHAAASCNASDVQTAINASSQGDVVAVPSCPSGVTWTAQVTNVVSTVALGIALVGQTTCAGSTPTSCTDNTVVTLADPSGPAISFTSPSSESNVIRISGFTFIWTGANPNSGQLDVSGTWPPAATVRFDHNHIEINSTAGGRFSQMITTYGLADHNLISAQPGAATGIMNPTFDDGSGGFYAWQQPTGLGSANAFFFENNYYGFAALDLEGAFDCQGGARTVFRYNTWMNGGDNGCHGTDSGSRRSAVFLEDYGNTYTNNTGGTQPMIGQQRGGTFLWWGNTYNGADGWKAAGLYCYRCGYQVTGVSQWGTADGTPWLLGSLTFTATGSRQNNDGGSDWSATNSYANLAAIYPLTNNTGHYNYTAQGACTSGSSTPAFTQTIGQTTAGDGSCTWLNEGGGPPGVGAHWCAINRDTPATSDATCAALTPGDTASTFFDGSGAGGYPARDQVGRGSNQGLQPDYEWLNSPDSGVFVPASNANYIQANRDYYLYTSSFTGATGVGSGSFANLPSACTPLVAYWATDRQTLYQCSSPNTWTVYYQPYPYPHPLSYCGDMSAVFGNCGPATTSAGGTAAETLYNNSGSAFSVNSVGISGASLSLTSNNCGGTLAASASCTFTVNDSAGNSPGYVTVGTSTGSYMISVNKGAFAGPAGSHPGIQVEVAEAARPNAGTGGVRRKHNL